MKKEDALKFKKAVDRKLSDEKISVSNSIEAHKALERCIMGKKLSEAFTALYEHKNSHNKFETDKTYSTRSACDYTCVFSFTVLKRTSKFITFRDESDKKTYRRGVYEYEGVEKCLPYGSYSMAPCISADRITE